MSDQIEKVTIKKSSFQAEVADYDKMLEVGEIGEE